MQSIIYSDVTVCYPDLTSTTGLISWTCAVERISRLPEPGRSAFLRRFLPSVSRLVVHAYEPAPPPPWSESDRGRAALSLLGAVIAGPFSLYVVPLGHGQAVRLAPPLVSGEYRLLVHPVALAHTGTLVITHGLMPNSRMLSHLADAPLYLPDVALRRAMKLARPGLDEAAIVAREIVSAAKTRITRGEFMGTMKVRLPQVSPRVRNSLWRDTDIVPKEWHHPGRPREDQH